MRALVRHFTLLTCFIDKCSKYQHTLEEKRTSPTNQTAFFKCQTDRKWEGRKLQTGDGEGRISRAVWIKRRKMDRWTDCLFFCYSKRTRDSQTESVKEKKTKDMREEAGSNAAASCHCRPLVRFSFLFFYLCAFSLKGRCSSESTNTESLSCIRTHTYIHTPCMRAKPCLIYKAKLRVIPAVPAADCFHASLPSLLQAQTMTTQAPWNPRASGQG